MQGIWGLSVLSLQCFYKSKTVLKNKMYLLLKEPIMPKLLKKKKKPPLCYIISFLKAEALWFYGCVYRLMVVAQPQE